MIKVSDHALGIGSHSGGNQFSMSFDGQEYNNFCPMYDLGSESMKAKYSTLFQNESTHSDIPVAIGAEIVPGGHSGNPFESLAVPMDFALHVPTDHPHSVSNDQAELRLIEEAKLKSIQDHELHQQRSDLHPKNCCSFGCSGEDPFVHTHASNAINPYNPCYPSTSCQ